MGMKISNIHEIKNQFFKSNINFLKQNFTFGKEKYKIMGTTMDISVENKGNSMVLNFFDKSTDTSFSLTKSSGTDTQMTSINSKLYAGQELSPTELAYLKEHAPELYEKAVRIALERKEFEKKLNRCKSKQEARELKLNKNLEIANSLKSGESASGNGEFALMRMSAIERAYAEFTKTNKYNKLPEIDENHILNTKKEDENTVDEYV